MPLPIEEELLSEMASQLVQYKHVCDYFGLSESQRKSAVAGQWIIEAIKQYQTSYNIMKSMRMNNNKTDVLPMEPEKTDLPPLPSE